MTDFLKDLGIEDRNLGGFCGEWLGSGSDSEVTTPIDGSRIATVQQVTEDEYDQIVARAYEAYLGWRRVPAPKRGEVVRQLGNRLRDVKRQLGELVTFEMGKILAEGEGEVQEMIDICDFAVGLSRQLYGLTMPSERPDHRMFEQWHPLGVVGVISAFNFPVAVWSWNTALASVCGDSVLWKPSSQTPLTAIACTKVAEQVCKDNDVDPAIFSLIIGRGSSVGDRMLHDKRVPLISATGSCKMGYRVGSVVGERLGRTILELGGNNAIIVTPHANMHLVLPAILFGAVGTAGQRCTSTRRIIVHESGMQHGPGYEAYLLGSEALGQRTPAGVSLAIARFREAIALDPNFAPAFASLATAYNLTLIYRYNIGVGGYETAGRALAAANRAIELDPELAAGYAARGFLASRALGPTEQAAADFRRALDLQPNAPEQPSWYSAILVQEGRTVEAMASAERGVSLSPYSPARHLSLATVALELNGYGLAVRAAHRVTELEPQITVSRALEGHALLLAGRLEQCLGVEFGPHDVVRATCLSELGRESEATAIVDSVINALGGGDAAEATYTDVTRLADLACHYAWTGDGASMLFWLERAFEVSPMGVWGRILHTSLFARMRNIPTTARNLNVLEASVWPRVEAASRQAQLP
ncbi:aldehyde dehydrogenase family protein [Gemmatimonadota bacterium]